MKLIHLSTALVLLAVSQSGCDERERVKGSGVESSTTRKVDEYHAVSLRGPFDVDFTDGPQEDITIQADDNILSLITTEIRDGQLIIGTKDNVRISHHRNIKITLKAPDVEEISLGGTGNIRILNEWAETTPVKLAISGEGNVEGTVNSPKVTISLSGSGEAEMKGETRDLNVTISGTGNFKGYDLHAENTTINISGAGNAEAHASVNLDVSVSGAGDVDYHGNPRVTQHVSGAGSVKKSD